MICPWGNKKFMVLLKRPPSRIVNQNMFLVLSDMSLKTKFCAQYLRTLDASIDYVAKCLILKVLILYRPTTS